MNKLGLSVRGDDKFIRLALDIDGIPLSGLVDIQALLRSLQIAASRYYLLTCSCGVAGCAGIDDMIVQVIDYTTDQLHWHFPEESYGAHFNGKSFVFNLKEFLAEIEKFKTSTRELESQGLRFPEFWDGRQSDDGDGLTESFIRLDDVKHWPIDGSDQLNSRKIMLFNSVSSIRTGLKQVKMTQGLKRETYWLEIMYVVNDVYEELAARTNNDLWFNPSLYTTAIIYVLDSVNEGAFIDDDLFFGCQTEFKGKVLKNAVMASFNKMMKMDQDPVKSIVSASSIKIISNKEEQ